MCERLGSTRRLEAVDVRRTPQKRSIALELPANRWLAERIAYVPFSGHVGRDVEINGERGLGKESPYQRLLHSQINPRVHVIERDQRIHDVSVVQHDPGGPDVLASDVRYRFVIDIATLSAA